MEPSDREVEAPLLDYHGKEEEEGVEEVGIVAETKMQFELGIPVVLMGWLDFSVQIISVAFVGRLGSVHLAGAAMAASFANVFGFAILEGLSGGMETSGGQAYGAGRSELLGYLLQRGQVVLLGFSLPISLLWLRASWVLRLWGQDVEIAELAGHYVLYLLPGLLATSCFLPVSKFLQVQGLTRPLAYVSCTVLVFHFPICWLYIYGLEMGFVGAALATSTSNVITLILLVLFLNFERSGILDRTWRGWSISAFKNLGPFLALALPACAMTSFEWWVFEIIQIMAGWLPHPDVAVSAMTIIFQTLGVCYMVPVGLGTAASIRVSNELGAQRPGRARWAFIVSMMLITIAAGIVAVILLVSRKEWVLLFTNDSETAVIETVTNMTSTVVMSIFGICWSAVLSGVLRGSGQLVAGSVINTLTLYGVAIPLAYFMGIRMQWGVEGLWWGLLAGITCQFVFQLILVARTKWDYQAKRALMTMDSNADETQTKSIVY